MDSFGVLTTINIELTSRCNKNCWMCGRRKVERDYPELALKYGDMDFSLVEEISNQLPSGIVVQFHDNGEPLLYPRFEEAIGLFNRQIRCMDTNGLLLVNESVGIIDNLDTITISVFEGDPEADEQYYTLKDFLEIKGKTKPNVIVRCLGAVGTTRYRELGCIIAKRVLHSPMGSFKYKKEPTIPEIGICLDALNHLVIKHDGRVSMCVRFDPKGLGVIGNCKTTSLRNIWNGNTRKERVNLHIGGKRQEVPLCDTCEYWGVPTGEGE